MDNTKLKRNIFRIFLFTFALVGLVFTFVYIGIQFGFFNVKGSVSERNSYFNITKRVQAGDKSYDNLEILCKINVLTKYAPITSINIYKSLNSGTHHEVIEKMIDVASRRFKNDFLFNDNMRNCINKNTEFSDYKVPMSAYLWADTEEWALMKEVFIRDQEVINKAARDAKISPRLIISSVIGEQFRFFSSRRESFKTYFEPLKILASLSNISYGIAGLKPKTVGIIEDNLKNMESPYYLGKDMENLIVYPLGANIEEERMNRITNAKDPYYSYLYVGLYMNQIISQWKKSGYDISNRPDALATLYNLGFYYSNPKENPQSGGSIISINGTEYNFGDIAYEFYYSGELSDIYPIEVQ